MFVNSNNIEIFPVAKIREDQGSRLFYEYNVANLTRQLLDNTGFVKKAPDETNIVDIDNKKCLEIKGIIFNLYGYYINIKSIILEGVSNTAGGQYIYAKLNFSSNIVNTPPEINGQDELDTDGVARYKGLEIYRTTTNEASLVDPNNTWVKLKLLESYTENNTLKWRVPTESFEKFDISKLVSGIDGRVN